MLDWQLLAVLAVLALAVIYLARQAIRTLRGRGAGCGGGCNCAPEQPGNLLSADDLMKRVRGSG